MDTDRQVQALRRDTGKACVSIASSLDTLPPASVPYDMRVRWLRALRQTTRAVDLVEERLVAAPEAVRPAGALLHDGTDARGPKGEVSHVSSARRRIRSRSGLPER